MRKFSFLFHVIFNPHHEDKSKQHDKGVSQKEIKAYSVAFNFRHFITVRFQ